MASTYLTMNQWMVPSKVSNKVECVNWGTWSSESLLEQEVERGKEGKEQEALISPQPFKSTTGCNLNTSFKKLEDEPGSGGTSL